MPLDNLYNSLSTFSISSILFRYLFDTIPSRVQLEDKSYLIYPLGIPSGIVFYHKICSSLFNTIQTDYFKNPSTAKNMQDSLKHKELVDQLFWLMHDVYNFDSSETLYQLLQNSNLKQIKYLLYIIKQQNFVYYEANKYNSNSYSTVISTIEQLDKILQEYKNQKLVDSGKNKLIEVDAIEYSEINAEAITMDYTTQFYKDYIIGNEGFYSILVNSYIHKLINITDHIPYFLRNDDPVFQCKVNNDKCIQSCRYFDPLCNKKYIKPFSYIPFRSIYVLPQLISLMKSYDREMELDMLIRGVLYSISSSFGEKGHAKEYYTFDHNMPIMALMDKNRSFVVKSLFNSVDFKDVENNVRASIGLTESKINTYDSIYDTLIKIYTFVNTNKGAFLKDDDRIKIFNDFLTNDVKPFLYDKTNTILNIYTKDDFTEYIMSISNEIIGLDKMLMKFPNDMNNLSSVVNNLLKMIKSTKQNLSKMSGSKMPHDPRETLLTSESNLFRRIAVDNNLYDFYRQNNKTKLVNSVLFQKWTLAYSFFSGMVLHLDDNHDIQKMDFNEI